MDTNSSEKRTCTICQAEKPLNDFESSRLGRFGKGSRCIACNSERMKVRRAKHAVYWQTHDPYKDHPVGRKNCRKCREEKPIADFALGRHNSDGLQAFCRSCSVDQWQKREYGMTTSALDACQICGEKAQGRRKRLNVDHDHQTGRVRGILCDTCNTALGLFKDSEYLLQKAIGYLRTSPALAGV